MPRVPNITDISRARRISLDRLSFGNVIKNKSNTQTVLKTDKTPLIALAPLIEVNNNASIEIDTRAGTFISANSGTEALNFSFTVEGNNVQILEYLLGDDSYVVATLSNGDSYEIRYGEITTLLIGNSSFKFSYEKNALRGEV